MVNKADEDMDTVRILRGLASLREVELKLIIKQAIKEWLEEQIVIFGRWSIRTLFAAALAAAIYFILIANGWTHK